MSHLRALLIVLIVVRLLMPPGICACKWSSPAARLLAALLQSDRQIPSAPERDNDDHEAGCPASPLSAGMGVAPPCEPFFPPGLALALPLPPRTMPSLSYAATKPVDFISFDAPSTPLYLTIRALLL